MELQELIKKFISTLRLDFCWERYVTFFGKYGRYFSKPVIMPLDIQEKIGKMLFSWTKDHEYYGFKAGTHATIRGFNLYFQEDSDTYYVEFYLALKQNWESYLFEIKDNDITNAKIPSHIEERTMPDKTELLNCIRKTIEMNYANR